MQEEMKSYEKNNHLCGDHNGNDGHLSKMATTAKRVNRNDTLQWSPMWGPPL